MDEWIEIATAGRRWRAEPGHIDLAIPLDFDGDQPRFFSDEPAAARPLTSGSFTGEVRSGASCNCGVYTLAPHCHGTHTECVGHLTADHYTLAQVTPQPVRLALLVTVDPRPVAGDSRERILTRESLAAAATRWDSLPWTALIVRTLPNEPTKRWRQYSGPCPAPYFVPSATAWIAGHGVASLVVDLPSLDRGDDGTLAAHRAYWGLPATSRSSQDATRAGAVVTELAYVPDRAADGMYLLDLQLPAFVADAAPSRPVIRAATEVSS